MIDQAGDVRSIRVLLNSPGGVATEGVAIYNLLAAHPAKVTMDVVAYAASAASVILQAGDERLVRAGSIVMVHNASGLTWGTADEHDKMAAVLRTLNTGMVSIYSKRTGQSEKKCADMMAEETWMSPADAVALGFADREIPAKSKADEPTTQDPAERASARSAPRRMGLLAQLADEQRGTLRSQFNAR
jgi:ATP-dependent protease ClpP protease subunit